MAITHIEYIEKKALFMYTQFNFKLVHSFQLLDRKRQKECVCVSVPHVTVSSCKVDAVVQR